jgi:SAM-dependent methyltransferase
LLTRLPLIATRLLTDAAARQELKRRIGKFYEGGFAEIFQGLPIFLPTSGGNSKVLASLTLRAAQNTFPLLSRLLERNDVSLIKPIAPEMFCRDDEARANAEKLGQLFIKYGSDKKSHNYHYAYAEIVKGAKNILEIGLGTKNQSLVSSMMQGTPGGSVRAFRDFLPSALIVGADIDRNILFSEERIETFYLDQTDLSTYKQLPARAYDVIIDDGLHTVDANLTVLIFAITALKPGGWIVIEDIHPNATDVWRVVATMIPDYECRLIKSDCLMFIARKPT